MGIGGLFCGNEWTSGGNKLFQDSHQGLCVKWSECIATCCLDELIAVKMDQAMDWIVLAEATQQLCNR